MNILNRTYIHLSYLLSFEEEILQLTSSSSKMLLPISSKALAGKSIRFCSFRINSRVWFTSKVYFVLKSRSLIYFVFAHSRIFSGGSSKPPRPTSFNNSSLQWNSHFTRNFLKYLPQISFISLQPQNKLWIFQCRFSTFEHLLEYLQWVSKRTFVHLDINFKQFLWCQKLRNDCVMKQAFFEHGNELV